MNQEQTNITTGKQIRHLRTQLGMTQEELAGELNVTRQALSNWERDVNEPDLNMLKKICFLFGVNMDDFAKEVITKMETYEKKEKRQFNKYDMAIGLFYGVGLLKSSFSFRYDHLFTLIRERLKTANNIDYYLGGKTRRRTA